MMSKIIYNNLFNITFVIVVELYYLYLIMGHNVISMKPYVYFSNTINPLKMNSSHLRGRHASLCKCKQQGLDFSGY
jgi:hypothetical protein